MLHLPGPTGRTERTTHLPTNLDVDFLGTSSAKTKLTILSSTSQHFQSSDPKKTTGTWHRKTLAHHICSEEEVASKKGTADQSSEAIKDGEGQQGHQF